MDSETVQIVLVGGPLDGETRPIPASQAGRTPWHFVPPYNPASLISMYVAPGEVVMPEPTRYLVYQPMVVDVGGWKAPSITDDGVMRYEYAGER